MRQLSISEGGLLVRNHGHGSRDVSSRRCTQARKSGLDLQGRALGVTILTLVTPHPYC
jgi:hypothetical protein